MSSRRSAWVAAEVLSLGIAVGYGPDAWWWATHEREYFFTWHDDFAGWSTRNRRTGEDEGPIRYWDIETGMMVIDGWRDSREERDTFFDGQDGRIVGQEWFRRTLDELESRSEPPWWWGAEPRTTADAPWTLEGITFHEWAQRLIERSEE